MCKTNLSEKEKKRINMLKQNNDGLIISEEDIKRRGIVEMNGVKQKRDKKYIEVGNINNNE